MEDSIRVFQRNGVLLREWTAHDGIMEYEQIV